MFTVNSKRYEGFNSINYGDWRGHYYTDDTSFLSGTTNTPEDLSNLDTKNGHD